MGETSGGFTASWNAQRRRGLFENEGRSCGLNGSIMESLQSLYEFPIHAGYRFGIGADDFSLGAG